MIDDSYSHDPNGDNFSSENKQNQLEGFELQINNSETHHSNLHAEAPSSEPVKKRVAFNTQSSNEDEASSTANQTPSVMLKQTSGSRFISSPPRSPTYQGTAQDLNLFGKYTLKTNVQNGSQNSNSLNSHNNADSQL